MRMNSKEKAELVMMWSEIIDNCTTAGAYAKQNKDKLSITSFVERQDGASEYATVTVPVAGNSEMIRMIDGEKHISTDELAEKINCLEELLNDEEFIFVAIEEMGELTQCLTKFLRRKEIDNCDYDHLHEEFADVLVCMNHLKSIFGFDKFETRKRMADKLDRAIERTKGVEE